MKRTLRWTGIAIATLLGLLVAFVGVASWVSAQRLSRTYDMVIDAPTVPEGPAAVASGARLAATRGCTDCHGDDLGSKAVLDDEDFARAVWYGVRPDGTPLAIMPSAEDHRALDASHLRQILVYRRDVPPVDREVPFRRIVPLARIGHALGLMPLLPVEALDTSEPPLGTVAVGATVEYSATIGILCTSCHGPELAGATAPSSDRAPNLTPHETGLGGWTRADLESALREGRRPDGTTLSDAMPWRNLGAVTDTEIAALWACLSTLEPVPSARES